MLVEGFNKSKNYIIVDDFIDSGKTIANIYYAIKKFSFKANCLGLLMVNEPYEDIVSFISLKDLKRCYRYAFKTVRNEIKERQ